jgi:hypothetical protein
MTTESGSPFERLQQALDREVTTWVGGGDDEPELVLGVVKALGERDNQHGSYPVVELVTREDEEIHVLGYRTVLKNRIYESGIEVGDYFAAKYLGQTTGKNDTKYHDYRVELLGADEKPKASRKAFKPDDGLDDGGEPPEPVQIGLGPLEDPFPG